MVSTFRFILFRVYSFVLKGYELKPSAAGSETPHKTTHSSEPSFQDMQIEKVDFKMDALTIDQVTP